MVYFMRLGFPRHGKAAIRSHRKKERRGPVPLVSSGVNSPPRTWESRGPAVRAKGSHPDGAHSRGPIGRGRVCTGCGAEGPRGAPDPDGGGTVGTVGCVNHQTRHAVHSKQLGSHPSHCASESGYDALRTARPGLPCGRRGGRTSRSPALRAGVRVAGGPLAAPARGDLCLTGLLGS